MLLFALSLLAQAPPPAVEPAPPPSAPAQSSAREAARPAAAPALSVSAAPAGPAVRARVLVLDLQGVGVSADDARLITGAIAALAAENQQIEVLTGADMRKLVEIAASKEQMGCGDASCLAEIAGALDAKFVIYGDVGRLGGRYLVNLSLFDSEKTAAAARTSAEVASLDVMRQALRPTVSDLLAPFGGLATAPADGGSPLVLAGAVTAGIGAAMTASLLVAAFVFDGIAGSPTAPFPDKSNALNLGLASLAGAGVGLLVTAGGAGVAALGALEGP